MPSSSSLALGSMSPLAHLDHVHPGKRCADCRRPARRTSRGGRCGRCSWLESRTPGFFSGAEHTDSPPLAAKKSALVKVRT